MSTIKVNTVTKRTGSTLTLGESGTTVTLACGATQTGFGRTGTVDWCTTAKTSPFTSVSGNGYFVNTSGGAVTVTLPASPSAGDIVAVADYANTWQTNALTLGRNGSKINAGCFCSNLTTEGASVTMVYVDATRGWKQVNDGTLDVTGQPNYVTATGGTILTCGDHKIHVFTADSTFCVSAGGNPNGSTQVDYLVVAGGGGGGGDYGGGGGAGGFRGSSGTFTCANPLIACVSGIPVSAQAYTITVGGGGTPGSGTPGGTKGGDGGVSTFSTVTSTGGGGGATEPPANKAGRPGGSGGGGSYATGEPPANKGVGNTPPVSPPQGNPGGTGGASPGYSTGGGGGAGAAGSGANNSPDQWGIGGVGSYSKILGTVPTAPSYGTPGPVSGSRYFSEGGEGAGPNPPAATFPVGGGGGQFPSPTGGGTNTGGGGAGGYPDPVAGGAGGSGIVILRYKFQN